MSAVSNLDHEMDLHDFHICWYSVYNLLSIVHYSDIVQMDS